MVCAQAESFVDACAEPFHMSANDKHATELSLHRSTVRGRVQSSRPLIRGSIYLVAANGVTLARADIAPDGAFAAQGLLAAADYVVIVSADQPLVVAPASESLTFALPDAGMDIDVRIDARNPQTDALIGLRIAGRHIPADAFFRHQAFRGLQPILYGKGPYRIPAIANVGAAEVILGPAPHEFANEGGIADVFLRQDLVAGRPRLRVPADGHLAFP
jgi:hypothetical protein